MRKTKSKNKQGKAKGSESDRHRVAPIWQQQVAKSQIPAPKDRIRRLISTRDLAKDKDACGFRGPFLASLQKQFNSVLGWMDLPCCGALVVLGIVGFFFHADVTWRSYGAQQLASFGLGPKSRGTVSRTMVRCGEGRAISGVVSYTVCEGRRAVFSPRPSGCCDSLARLAHFQKNSEKVRLIVVLGASRADGK